MLRSHYTSAVKRQKLPFYGRGRSRAVQTRHFAEQNGKKFEKFFTIPLPFGARLEYNKAVQAPIINKE